MSLAKRDQRLDLVGPLCDAALRGDINALKELVKNGANVNRDVRKMFKFYDIKLHIYEAK